MGRIFYDRRCSCKMPALSFHSAVCLTPQSTPNAPYTGQEYRYYFKLNWVMERGLHYTPQKKLLLCHIDHYFLVPVFSQSTFSLHVPCHHGSCLHPSNMKFYLPSVSLLHTEWFSFYLGCQTGSADCSQRPSAHSNTPPISFLCCYSCYLFLFLSLGAPGTWQELHCFPFVLL